MSIFYLYTIYKHMKHLKDYIFEHIATSDLNKNCHTIYMQKMSGKEDILYTFEDYCNENNILCPMRHDLNEYHNRRYGLYKLMLSEWNYDIYQVMLYETLYKVGDAQKLLNVLKEKYKYIIDPHKSVASKAHNDLKQASIKLYADDIWEYKKDKEFIKLLNLYNFYIESERADDEGNTVLRLNPKYDEEISNYIKEECNNIVYHITKKDNLNNIYKYGLIPKGNVADNGDKQTLNRMIKKFKNPLKKITKHPERIYFLDSHASKTQIDYLKKELSIGEDSEFVVLEIDLNKMKEPIKIFRDPDSNSALCIWTAEPIYPTCISEFNMSDKSDETGYVHKESFFTKLINRIFKN